MLLDKLIVNKTISYKKIRIRAGIKVKGVKGSIADLSMLNMG